MTGKRFATSPHNLPFVNRTVAEVEAGIERPLSDDDRAVIRERFHGWEKCPADTLGAIFGVSRQRIVAVVNEPHHRTTGKDAR